MKSKPKIAVIGLKGLPAFGGAAVVGENIIEQLKERYDFTVYSSSTHTESKTGIYKGYKQIVFLQNKKNSLMTLLYYLKSVYHILFIENYDLVHLHHNAVSFLIPYIRIKYKVVLTTHGLFTEEKFNYLKYFYLFCDLIFLRFSNAITTVSKEDYRKVCKLGVNNVIFIPNGIQISEKIYPNFEEEHDYLLFAAGRIHRGKSCHILLNALIQMNYSGRVIIAGDTNQSIRYKKNLQELANRLRNIRFTGMIRDKEKLYSCIKNAKLFVYPSHAEAMSIMMLEVAALRTPMICCDCQVNRDLFTENEVLFAEQGNILDWKKKIEYALNNTDELKKKSNNAYEKLIAQYTWEKISKQYHEVFNEYLK